MAANQLLLSSLRTKISHHSLPLGKRASPLRKFLHSPFHSSHSTYSKYSRTSSVNAEEVAHFNALASTWWDYHGPSKLLHLMNPLRHDFIACCFNNSKKNTTYPVDSTPSYPHMDGYEKLDILDVGCGGGIFAESAARLSNVRSVTAIDPTPDVIAVAKAHARRDPLLQSKLTYRNISIENMKTPTLKDDQFDILTLFEVIEHITYPAEFLEQCTKFVRPGGWIVISTMARTLLSWLTTIAVGEYGLRIVPIGTHNWRKYINSDELNCWFSEKGGWNSQPVVLGVVYIPGIGWKPISGSEKVGNYFFGIRRDF
ncbi:Ubiquinone biosynthesis O-methyltransferase, mitochondrial [Erysiphe neolycopersici]|uniref:Ubiquinone biosynthesis O-methyltransferase, mitochondrial n=1 Tax=Erysiphe neolycopersici TaxID=212602 RepID=A0A420H7L1_9PEZI|nr:Ubiquinone biosynthesis O-methyltransferase, mitochondrial [Erysiphe neolycopersici]